MKIKRVCRIKVRFYIIIAFLFILSINIHAQHTKEKQPLEPVEFSSKVDLPKDFGKKHFIVGVPSDFAIPRKKTPEKINCQGLLCGADGKITQALFTPDDNVQEVLIDLINKEKKQINIAVFSFTNKKIAQALLDACKRGITVCIIVDGSGVNDRFGKIDMLKKGGAQIFVYKQVKTKSLFPDKMHNKFVVFEKNLLNRRLVWTGSFNFTRSAAQSNQENVVVLDNENIVDRFTHQFKQLQQRSSPLTYKKELRTVVM